MATTERAAPIFPAGLFIGNILQGRPRGAVESGRAGGRKEGKITRKKRKHRRRKGEWGGREKETERKKERETGRFSLPDGSSSASTVTRKLENQTAVFGSVCVSV